jgi:hypothetical protein
MEDGGMSYREFLGYVAIVILIVGIGIYKLAF